MYNFLYSPTQWIQLASLYPLFYLVSFQVSTKTFRIKFSAAIKFCLSLPSLIIALFEIFCCCWKEFDKAEKILIINIWHLCQLLSFCSELSSHHTLTTEHYKDRNKAAGVLLNSCDQWYFAGVCWLVRRRRVTEFGTLTFLNSIAFAKF